MDRCVFCHLPQLTTSLGASPRHSTAHRLNPCNSGRGGRRREIRRVHKGRGRAGCFPRLRETRFSGHAPPDAPDACAAGRGRSRARDILAQPRRREFSFIRRGPRHDEPDDRSAQPQRCASALRSIRICSNSSVPQPRWNEARCSCDRCGASRRLAGSTTAFARANSFGSRPARNAGSCCMASVLSPKFVSFCSALLSELRIQKDTRNYNSSVVLVRKSANGRTEQILRTCEPPH